MCVPGFTEHAEDVPIFVQHFLKKYSQTYGKSFQGLTRRAQIALLQHDWPVNVRELENVISSAIMTADSGFIDLGHLPEHLQRPTRASQPTKKTGVHFRSLRCAESTSSAYASVHWKPRPRLANGWR